MEQAQWSPLAGHWPTALRRSLTFSLQHGSTNNTRYVTPPCCYLLLCLAAWITSAFKITPPRNRIYCQIVRIIQHTLTSLNINYATHGLNFAFEAIMTAFSGWPVKHGLDVPPARTKDF